MISTLLSTLIAPQESVELYRKFAVGKTYAYAVRAHMQTESREVGLTTFIPNDTDLNYDFDYKVLEVKNSGLAKVRYNRPTLTEIQGETAERPPLAKTYPVNYKLELELSPVNAVTGIKDLNPSTSSVDQLGYRKSFRAMSKGERQDIVSEFAGELQRLALFFGDLEGSLDFAPKLPLSEVKVGESWKNTMSYQPMELKGSGGKFEVQRLDMTLTYKGTVDRNGKKFVLINGAMKLDSDAAKYINQMMRMTPSQSGLSKLPLKLDSQIEFLLDPVSLHTVQSTAKTTGGWSLILTGVNEAYQEERIKGKATLTLKSLK
jgi:hypothetical protein